MEPLVHDDQILCFRDERLIAETEPPADVHERILLAAHGGTVGQVAHHAQDLGDRAIPHADLALLDEPRVLDGTRGIQHHLDAACATVAPDIEHVLHAHRLPAGEVDRHRDADVGNPLGANLPHQRIEFSDVDVALERMR